MLFHQYFWYGEGSFLNSGIMEFERKRPWKKVQGSSKEVIITLSMKSKLDKKKSGIWRGKMGSRD